MISDDVLMEETRVLLDQYPDGSVAEAAQQLPSRGNILAQLGGWLVAGASRHIYWFRFPELQLLFLHGVLWDKL